MKYIGNTILSNTKFDNVDVQAVANNTDWSKIDFAQAVGNLNFAKNFTADAQSMIKGTMQIDSKDYNTAMNTISDWVSTAKSLFGDNPDYKAEIDQAANSMYSRIGTMKFSAAA